MRILADKDKSECIRCGKCEDGCPAGAISIRMMVWDEGNKEMEIKGGNHGESTKDGEN